MVHIDSDTRVHLALLQRTLKITYFENNALVLEPSQRAIKKINFFQRALLLSILTSSKNNVHGLVEIPGN